MRAPISSVRPPRLHNWIGTTFEFSFDVDVYIQRSTICAVTFQFYGPESYSAYSWRCPTTRRAQTPVGSPQAVAQVARLADARVAAPGSIATVSQVSVIDEQTSGPCGAACSLQSRTPLFPRMPSDRPGGMKQSGPLQTLLESHPLSPSLHLKGSFARLPAASITNA
jgi:hypothetical protein